jgi:hypothetical protein
MLSLRIRDKAPTVCPIRTIMILYNGKYEGKMELSNDIVSFFLLSARLLSELVIFVYIFGHVLQHVSLESKRRISGGGTGFTFTVTSSQSHM